MSSDTCRRSILAAVACALMAALPEACTPAKPTDVPAAVILDEAFALAHPGLAASFRRIGRPLLGPQGFYAEVPLSRGSDGLLSEAARAGYKPGKTSQRGALILSPLFAASLSSGESALAESGNPGTRGVSGLRALGGARLVVPDWLGAAPPWLTPVVVDWPSAFHAAGRSAGAYVAALKKAGQPTATCGLLFAATLQRGDEAVDAFVSGFEDTSGGDLPVIERLAGLGEGGGSAETGGKAGHANGGGVQGDKGAALDAAVARLLAADIRIVLVAAGSATVDASIRLARAGMALGIESSRLSDRPAADFGIFSDDEAMAARCQALALDDRPRGPARSERVPALVGYAPSAEAFTAGDANLAKLLAREGGKAMKSSERRTSAPRD